MAVVSFVFAMGFFNSLMMLIGAPRAYAMACRTSQSFVWSAPRHARCSWALVAHGHVRFSRSSCAGPLKTRGGLLSLISPSTGHTLNDNASTRDASTQEASQLTEVPAAEVSAVEVEEVATV